MTNKLYRTLSITLLLTTASLTHALPSDLKPIKLHHNKIIMNIPAAFHVAKADDDVSKDAEKSTKAQFNDWQKPKIVLIDNDYNNIIIDFQQKQLKTTELAKDMQRFAHEFATIFPFADIYEKKIIKINGQPFASLKIKAPTANSNETVYSRILYTAVNNKKVSFTIFLNDHDYQNWQPLMDKITASIKVNS